MSQYPTSQWGQTTKNTLILKKEAFHSFWFPTFSLVSHSPLYWIELFHSLRRTMQHDSLIWQIINNEFCSFKSKLKKEKQAFCRNPYNVTGLCARRHCPLANSRYATIREEQGKCYLYGFLSVSILIDRCMKTIERAHSPKNLWEKVELPANKEAAIAAIEKNLQYWPEFLITKNKQRYLRIQQYLKRMRKLRLRGQYRLDRLAI